MSKTRMHSSRTRTVCSSSHLLGGVSAPGGSVLGGLLLGACLLLGGVVALWEVCSWWVVCSQGVSALGGVSAPGVQCQSDPP